MSRRVELDNGGVYEGAVAGGVLAGAGKMTYANGDVYEGEFKDDMRWGKGVFTSVAGDVYEGDWTNDKRDGLGRCAYADGSVYEGSWMHDKRDYKGRLSFLAPHPLAGDAYDGRWKEGKRSGAGKYVHADGRVYDGAWKDDKRQGPGKLFGVSGEVEFDGEWDNDKPKKKLVIAAKRAEPVDKADEASDITPDMHVTYEALTSGAAPATLDPTRKEQYLSDEEFASLFDMSKADFAKKAKWQRDGKKRELGLM